MSVYPQFEDAIGEEFVEEAIQAVYISIVYYTVHSQYNHELISYTINSSIICQSSTTAFDLITDVTVTDL